MPSIFSWHMPVVIWFLDHTCSVTCYPVEMEPHHYHLDGLNMLALYELSPVLISYILLYYCNPYGLISVFLILCSVFGTPICLPNASHGNWGIFEMVAFLSSKSLLWVVCFGNSGKLHLRLNTNTRPIVKEYLIRTLKRTWKREFKRVWNR